MHVGPVAVSICIAFNGILSIVTIPFAVPMIHVVIVKLFVLSEVALVILRVAVRVGPDGLTCRFIRASLPVHLDLLEFLQGLVFPDLASLVRGPAISTPPCVVFVIHKVKASLTGQRGILELA